MPIGIRILLFILCLLVLWVPIAWPLSELIPQPLQLGPLTIQDAKSIITLLILY